MEPATEKAAFPVLSKDDVEAIRDFASLRECDNGCTIFKAGDPSIDFYMVLEGELEILNPTDNNRCIATHGPGEFAGDIDLLTRRPTIVTCVASKPSKLLRVEGKRLRELVNRVPRLGDKLLDAFQIRRKLLEETGTLGLKIVGPGSCKDTTVVREFLFKNFVPFTYHDSESEKGKVTLKELGNPKKTPAIVCNDGKVLLNPSLFDLAKCAGVWADCPTDTADLAIVGAGPAGIAAAVYASSEGLKTTVLDRLGPGGQAGASSKIENFIGFPSGLSGTELATRGVLQMLKFGARISAPVNVMKLEPGKTPDAPHELHLDCGAIVRAAVVLVATGVSWRRLEAKGVQKFDNAGIYYACTTVEADVHQGHELAVVGAGNSAGQAAMFLSEHCARTVHLIIRKELGAGMSLYLADRIRAASNITVHNQTEVKEVFGDRRITEIEIETQPGNQRSRIPVKGMFIFIGAEPHAEWLPDSVSRDSLGYLLTGVDAERCGKWPLKDRLPCALETTLPGVLAAGDVRAGSTKRVGFAVGDGSLAVTCVHRLRMLRQ